MRRSALAWPLLAALCAALPASAATFVARTSASGSPGPGGEQKDMVSGQLPVLAQSEHQGSRLVPYDPIPPVAPYEAHTLVSSRATASADMGGVHLLANASGLIEDAQPYYFSTFSAHAKASGGFGDSFTISAPGAVGFLQGTASFSVHALLSGAVQLAGSQDPAIPGNAEVYVNWTARMVVSGANGILGDVSLSGGCNSLSSFAGGSFRCGGDPLGVYAMSLSFAAGQTLSVSIEGEVSTSVFGTQARGGMAQAVGQADFGHTLAWGGFQDVRDANGNPVAGFSALSASTGFDYAAPFPATEVPEPSSWLLLLCGLVGVVRLRQRRSGMSSCAG
ncbi:PEP-CTERM sorting domain-containing protein [Pelomonas sp. Root1217]|uniref:PEP-CTERM sorting domain-containing protein n=1 Tax=Pelomonas sp. Root1217 TaxID=1736430 RepID=UPI000ADC725F|nr:PEP-CTERM sorting domain-containing protein [Pelomonas sp. Root1217]